MSYTDNPSARFLYAILKQKNLKDIDWNEVARDPILAQPITNGHAARMRYSRLRTAILGGAQAKKPPEPAAFKVTKARKQHADPNKMLGAKSFGAKPAPGYGSAARLQPKPAASSTSLLPIKQEPDAMASPHQRQSSSPVADYPMAFPLTPISDDMLPPLPPLPPPPPPPRITPHRGSAHGHGGFLLHAAAADDDHHHHHHHHGCDRNPDHMHFPDHDGLWSHAAAQFPTYNGGGGYNLAAGYELAASADDCDHSRTQGLAGLETEMESMTRLVRETVAYAIKREEER